MDGKLIEKLVSEEARSAYTFTREGIVTNPGKFEGESIAALYFYDCWGNGDNPVFEVTEDERAAFGIKPFVYLQEDSNGFVSLVEFDTLQDAEEYQNEFEGIEIDDLE